MVDSVATVWLPVQDMTRAVAFYRDTLGLTITGEDDDWSEIDADGLMIGLNAREEASGSSSGGAVMMSSTVRSPRAPGSTTPDPAASAPRNAAGSVVRDARIASADSPARARAASSGAVSRSGM